MKSKFTGSHLGVTLAIIAIVVAVKGLSLLKVANQPSQALEKVEAYIQVDESCQYGCCVSKGQLPPLNYICPNQR